MKKIWFSLMALMAFTLAACSGLNSGSDSKGTYQDISVRELQGMFENNILTFNPGWDNNARKLDTFTDVRELQRQLKAQGVELVSEADESTTGPASFIAVDPDGNPILVDQHV